MADYRRYFSGVYLSAPDLDGDVIARIIAVKGGDVEDTEKGTMRHKMIVELEGRKPWLPCKTSAACLAAMWGNDEQKWAGHTVILYNDPTVRVGSEVLGGIRVRGGDIPKPIRVKIKLQKRAAFSVDLRPITQDRPTQPSIPTLEDLLKDQNVTIADLDRVRAVSGKPPVSSLSPEKQAEIAVYFFNNPDKIAKIKETP